VAYTLTAGLNLSMDIALDNAADLSTPRDALTFAYGLAFATGIGASQANRHWHERMVIGAGLDSGRDLKDLYNDDWPGDAFSNPVVFDAVRALLIVNRNTGAGEILKVGGALVEPWTAWVGNYSDKFYIGPGGVLLLTSPGAAGLPVAVDDHWLKFDNANAVALTLDLIIIGSKS